MLCCWLPEPLSDLSGFRACGLSDLDSEPRGTRPLLIISIIIIIVVVATIII